MTRELVPVPASVRLLAELLAKQPRVYAGRGKTRMELLFDDGKLVEFFVNERVSPRDLALTVIEFGDLDPDTIHMFVAELQAIAAARGVIPSE